MLGGTLVLEAMKYDAIDIELPVIDPQTSLPTGEVVQRRVIRMQPLGTNFVVEVRIAPEDWDSFVKEITGKKVITADESVLRSLPRMNGGA